jgi:dihydroneopterin aldolase
MPIASAAEGIRHVFIHGLVLPAHIGVFAAEQGRAQRIRVSVDLGVADTQGRDELARVVDYSVIVGHVRRIVAAGHVRLVETLAERIAESCLADERIFSARIRVEKLDIYPDAEGAGVEIERRRR